MNGPMITITLVPGVLWFSGGQPMKKREQLVYAAKLLKISEEKAEEYGAFIPGTNIFYVSVPEKGGGSLLVDDDGSVLFAGSAVGFDEHFSEFRQGRRTPIAFFN